MARESLETDLEGAFYPDRILAAHACGLSDVYDRHQETTLVVEGGPTRERMPDDWGWYPPNVMQTNIVRRLLMYGRRSDTKADISYGDVYGLCYTSSKHLR